MKFALYYAALIGLSASTPAFAASPAQPPMDQFHSAFYRCDAGGAFSMSYNAAKPSKASMTTSNDNHRYELKRAKVSEGVQFTDGKVVFWTDGKMVRVDGTIIPLSNCSTKAASAG